MSRAIRCFLPHIKLHFFCLVIILKDYFLFVRTFSLLCARPNEAVSKRMYDVSIPTQTITKHPIPAGFKLEVGCELKEKSFSMGTNLQWKLYHFDYYCSWWHLHLWACEICRLHALLCPSVVPHSTHTHACSAQANAHSGPAFSGPPSFEIYVNSVFVFHQTTQLEEVTLFLMNIVVGAGVGVRVPGLCVYHKVICIHFRTH